MSNGWEKIKLEEEAISEILVADTDLESGAEASNVEDDFEEEEEEDEDEAPPPQTRWVTNWKTHYMNTGQDLDSYTIHCMARPWYETDFYT